MNDHEWIPWLQLWSFRHLMGLEAGCLKLLALEALSVEKGEESRVVRVVHKFN